MSLFKNKSGTTNLAVPLLEALVLPLLQNSNTIVHAICRVKYTQRRTQKRAQGASSCRNVLEVQKFTRFQVAKTSVNKRLLSMSPLFYAVGASGSGFTSGTGDGYYTRRTSLTE